ncbi:MAG: response regulator [Polyangiaceae bacterium]|jgi:DNA-binding response OmpR family regulator|nr:response regulator [Polyangiaceae bacterium]
MPAKDPSKAVVLVADDEPSMLSLIAQHVKTLGHDVHIAHDGEEAWDMVQKHRPDLVLLDVMMPAMSGWEVCRKVREDEGFERVGVIMITGIGETLNELTSPLFGADAYLDKPFELVDLDRSIREVLAKRRSAPKAAGAEVRGTGATAKPASGKGKAAAKTKGE